MSHPIQLVDKTRMHLRNILGGKSALRQPCSLMYHW